MARPGLSVNRKFLRLARALENRALARGILELLWEPCFEVGEPYIGTSDDIEAVCGWTGRRGALTQALLDAGLPKGAGFIEPYEGNVRDRSQPHFQIHDFYHHCPEYAKSRGQREREKNAPKRCATCGGIYYSSNYNSRYCGDRCRQAAHRGVTDPVTHVTDAVTHPEPENTGVVTDASRMSQSCHALSRDVTICHGTPTPTPTPTPAPSTNVRPVEKTTTAPTASTAVAVADASDPFELQEAPTARPHQRPQKARKADPPPDDSVIVLTFPVVGKGGPWWHLREAQITRWGVLYPGLDVVGEARQALAWIEANDARRKTAGGMKQCLVSWFNRSVDSPRRGPTVVTGSLKTAGNQAAIKEFLQRRGHVVE